MNSTNDGPNNSSKPGKNKDTGVGVGAVGADGRLGLVLETETGVDGDGRSNNPPKPGKDKSVPGKDKGVGAVGTDGSLGSVLETETGVNEGERGLVAIDLVPPTLAPIPV
ncbi:MAG: hypothetical protein AAB642_03245 [Patescibacteria group bacterium]